MTINGQVEKIENNLQLPVSTTISSNKLKYISSRIAYLKEDLKTAANHVVNETLVKAGGSGGIISVDKYGNVAMPHNTPGMYRGYAKPDDRGVFIYGGE